MHEVLSLLGRFRLWGLVILVCNGMCSIPNCVFGLDRFNPLCGGFSVLQWFSNWSTVWGRVKVCRPWGIVSRARAGRISQDPQNFLENRRKKLFRFFQGSGVVIRVSKLSMMSLRDRKSVSFHCSLVLECGACSARVLR